MTDNRFYSTVQAICLVLIVAVIIVFLSLPAEGKPLFPLPPELDKVTNYGCTATQARVPQDNTYWWHIRVSAAYKAGEKWIHLFAIREGTDRKNAMKDCSTWLTEMEKALKKMKKSQFQKSEYDIPPPDEEEVQPLPGSNVG